VLWLPKNIGPFQREVWSGGSGLRRRCTHNAVSGGDIPSVGLGAFTPSGWGNSCSAAWGTRIKPIRKSQKGPPRNREAREAHLKATTKSAEKEAKTVEGQKTQQPSPGGVGDRSANIKKSNDTGGRSVSLKGGPFSERQKWEKIPNWTESLGKHGRERRQSVGDILAPIN